MLKKLKTIAKVFDISNEIIFPIMIGIVFGLAYGVGIIIKRSFARGIEI